MGRKIRTGIIGGSINNGWARGTHIPALQQLEEYELTAVGTSRMESARQSAEAFGAAHAFDRAADLAGHPDVDLAVVSINVKEHHAAVRAIVPAGKPIYCEWPLGSNTAEALEMRQWVTESGIPNAIGLQARQAPAVNYVKDLVKQGFVGKVLSAKLNLSIEGMGGESDKANSYLFDREVGGSLLTIVTGHNLDAFTYMLGDFKELSAVTAQQFAEVRITDTNERMTKTTDDQILINGLLESGAAAQVHVQGGVKHGTGLTIEIFGDQGTLVLSAPATIQFGSHRLRGAGASDAELRDLDIPASYVDVPESLQSDSGFVLNVAHAYRKFAADIAEGTSTAPNFDEAVKLHQLLDAVEESARTGKRHVF